MRKIYYAKSKIIPGCNSCKHFIAKRTPCKLSKDTTHNMRCIEFQDVREAKQKKPKKTMQQITDEILKTIKVERPKYYKKLEVTK